MRVAMIESLHIFLLFFSPICLTDDFLIAFVPAFCSLFGSPFLVCLRR